MGNKKQLTLDDVNVEDIEVMSTPEEVDALRSQFESSIPEDEYHPKSVQQQLMEPIEAFGMGAGQGATLSFGDEILGGVAAGGESLLKGQAGQMMLQDPKALKEFLETYEAVRDQARGAYKKRADEYPAPAMLGEFAGGMYLPGMGSLSTGKKVVQGADALADAAKAAKMAPKLTGMKAVGNVIADTAKGGTKGALTGGVYGSLYGAGASEADVARKGEYEKLLQDIEDYGKTGAILGAGLGATVSGVKSGVSNLTKMADDNEMLPQLLQDVREAYRREKSGQKIVGKGALNTLEVEIEKVAKEMEDELAKQRSAGGKMQKQALSDADKAGIKFNIRQLLEKYRQDAMKLPDLSDAEKAEKAQILRMLDEVIEGQKVSKEVQLTKPSYGEGKTFPSGEDEAIAKLKKLVGAHNVDNELGVPGQQAETKLRQKHALKELTSEEQNTVPFRNPETAPTTAGIEGQRIIGPEGDQMAALINQIDPGDIKMITDPKTKEQFAVLFDKQGKVIRKVPVNQNKIGYSVPSYTPPTTKTVTERVGGSADEVSPTKLQEIGNSFRSLGYHGSDPVQGKEAVKITSELNDDLRNMVTGDLSEDAQKLVTGSMGDNAQKVKDANKIIHAAADAEEILFPALKGASEAERLKINMSLSKTIRDLDKPGGADARRIVRAALERIKETNPQVSEKMAEKMLDKATAYDLARQISRESPSKVVGWTGQIAVGTGALAGRASHSGKPLRAVKALIRGSTPYTLREMRDELAMREDTPQDLLSKLDAAERATSDKERQAMMFDIMQVPAYRQLLGASNYDDDEG
jgi:hypothetical protein